MDTFSADQIKGLRKELLGLRLMNALVKVCNEKRVASRATVYIALTHTRYNDDRIAHRAIVQEAIQLALDNGGNVDWYNPAGKGMPVLAA